MISSTEINAPPVIALDAPAPGAPLRDHDAASFVRPSYGLVNRAVQFCDVMACILPLALLRTAWIVSAQPLSLLQSMMAGALAGWAAHYALRMFGAYRVERYQRAEWAVLDVLAAWAAAVGVVIVVLWACDQDVLAAKRWMLTWTLLMLGALLAERAVLFTWLRRAIRAGLLRRHVAVVGSGVMGLEIRNRLLAENKHYRFVGLFEDAGEQAGASGGVEDLCRLALGRRLDLIVLALPWNQGERIFALAEQMQWISADVVAPIEPGAFLSSSDMVEDVGGAPMLQLTNYPFKGTEGLVKVAEDYLIAALAFIAFAPVMLAAAVAVRLSGPGPVLFRQARVGFNGRRFFIYKFRTMTVDPDDDGSLGTWRTGQRITKVGRWLRRTSMDELPQLFNVLRGEMSVVGPRPHVPNMFIEERSYAETVRAYAARHRIKPGITGWAQINGMRGGIDSVAKAKRGVELDLEYIKAWSLRLDLTIMLRTMFGHMVSRRVF